LCHCLEACARLCDFSGLGLRRNLGGMGRKIPSGKSGTSVVSPEAVVQRTSFQIRRLGRPLELHHPARAPLAVLILSFLPFSPAAVSAAAAAVSVVSTSRGRTYVFCVFFRVLL